MPIMSLKSFKDGTSKWFSLRNGAIKAIDDALELYHAVPNDRQRLRNLKDAIDAFKQEKDTKFAPKGGDYTDSKREKQGIITLLGQQVAAELAPNVPLVGPNTNLTSIASAARLKAIARQNNIQANSTDVVVPVSQQLDYRDGNGLQDFQWTVRFKMTEAPTELVIKVYLKTSTTGAVTADYKKLWPAQIGSAWSKAVLEVPEPSGGMKRLSIRFELEWCDPAFTGDAYEVDVHQPPALAAQKDYVKQGSNWVKQDKSATVGTAVGTPHMGQWGADDRVAVVHEFGHMIGCPDEYYTQTYNGTALPASVYDQVPFTTSSIMNNTGPEGRIFPRHYEVIRQQYEIWQGLTAGSVRVTVKG